MSNSRPVDGLPIRRMGRTGMTPAALGLGAAWLNQCSESETISTILRAIELGINYIDTYPGHNEERWGKALQNGRREQIYLQAKVGTHPQRRKDFSVEGTRWSVEQSLRSLQTDYLDAVLIHDPIQIEDTIAPNRALDELVRMKEAGLIGSIGLGVRPHDFHRSAIETGQIDIILTFLDYTLLDQSVAETTLPLARQHDIGIILASVFGMGLLTGLEPDLESDRRRHPDREPIAHRLWQWCQTEGINIRHLAMQFCLQAPIDGIVMFGPSSIQHVEEAVQAAKADVPLHIWQELETEFGIKLGAGFDHA